MKTYLTTIICLIFGLHSFSQNTNLSDGTVFDGEPYVAINPNDSNNIVVAWMGWVNVANQFQIKTKTSFDAGNSWSNTGLIPHVVSSYSSADPSIAFNNNGEVFISYIDFTGTTPPVTGGVYLVKSLDGGLSWGNPVSVINTTFDGTKWPIDRPWMAIDRSTTSTQGTIYVTSMNLNRTNAPFNPYVSISTNNGVTFSTSYLDTTNWLAGSANNLPMPSPIVSSTGVFYASYPSFVVTQSPFARLLLASSDDAGTTFTHRAVGNIINPVPLTNFPDAKKAGLLLSNPANASHIATIGLRTTNGDLDVFLTESFDAGTTWNAPIRVNDDPISNDRMQDLIWGDFDNDGDLVITWRDRRNGIDGTYSADSEIYAAYRPFNATQFQPNFRLSSLLIPYDPILTSSGNDFMSVQLENDIIHAVWGDPRNGHLNIWFQKTDTQGNVLSLQEISSDQQSEIKIFPNPASSSINIQGKKILEATLVDIQGKEVFKTSNNLNVDELQIPIEGFSNGTYVLQIKTYASRLYKKVIIQN
ncbi:MAG: T9SS type A sorting domain-containing protein [Nonlabens sp.]|uniref:T9SS type A sorting domain-containing protein n=1 Tax=Nonlabens sp. TaxID=1888209 RepID=UPI00321C14F4